MLLIQKQVLKIFRSTVYFFNFLALARKTAVHLDLNLFNIPNRRLFFIANFSIYGSITYEVINKCG